MITCQRRHWPTSRNSSGKFGNSALGPPVPVHLTNLSASSFKSEWRFLQATMMLVGVGHVYGRKRSSRFRKHSQVRNFVKESEDREIHRLRRRWALLPILRRKRRGGVVCRQMTGFVSIVESNNMSPFIVM